MNCLGLVPDNEVFWQRSRAVYGNPNGRGNEFADRSGPPVAGSPSCAAQAARDNGAKAR